MTHPPARAAGFSLIEILIAALLIGTLAAVSIPNALSARVRGNDNTAKVIVANLAAEQERHEARENDYWPLSGGDETYHPNDYELPAEKALVAIDFPLFEDTNPPKDYKVLFYTRADASGNPAYCIAAQHAHNQSNVWVWTSRSIGEEVSIDREDITAFEADVKARCDTEIDY